MQALLLFISLLIPVAEPVQAAKPQLTPQQVVEMWFVRLNELDDWRIAMDGTERTDQVVNSFLELYAPDATHEVSPNERQIGETIYRGPQSIRRWVEDFAKTYVDLDVKINFVTRSPKTVTLFHQATTPWGVQAVAVEFNGLYAFRNSRKKYSTPGAAFFQIENGKITSVRLYILKNDSVEVSPVN